MHHPISFQFGKCGPRMINSMQSINMNKKGWGFSKKIVSIKILLTSESRISIKLCNSNLSMTAYFEHNNFINMVVANIIIGT